MKLLKRDGRRTGAPRPAAPRDARILALIAIVLILAGAGLRCYHVERKVFWDDEVIASMHVLGETESDLVARVAEFGSIADLRAVMHPTANLRPVSATIEALRTEDPQHPPLYYLIARTWVAAFGDSLATLRTLSAVIALLALPSMFWLAYELFGSLGAALCATALAALSPVDIVCAGQIREYGLWLVAILIMSALFVRALRTNSVALWLLYSIALSLGCYVFPGTLLVAVAHAGVAFLSSASPRARATATAAIVLGCLTFVPWALVMLGHLDQIARGMGTTIGAHTSVTVTARTLIGLIRLDVFDFNGRPKWLALAMAVPVLAVVGYAVVGMRRSDSDVRRWFVWSLIACTAAPLVVADLLTGGHRTSSTRYFLPLFLAIDVALVDLFVRAVLYVPARTKRPAWLTVFAVIFAFRLGSCAANAHAQTWWGEYNNRSIDVAASLNAAVRPLLMGDDYIVWALSLSEYADPHIRLALNPRCYLCTAPDAPRPDAAALVRAEHPGSVFLLGPSKALQQNVLAVLGRQTKPPDYTCINIRANCSSSVALF